MTTKDLKIERSAEIKGDKVIITSKSSAIDEQSIGQFREEYLRRQTEIGGLKDQIKSFEKELIKTNELLKKEDMHLLKKLKPKVELLIKKEFMDSRVADMKKGITAKQNELDGLKETYDKLTKEEMTNRAK